MLQAQCKGASLRPPLASGPRIKPGCVECGYTVVAALTTFTFTFITLACGSSAQWRRLADAASTQASTVCTADR